MRDGVFPQSGEHYVLLVRSRAYSSTCSRVRVLSREATIPAAPRTDATMR